MPKWARRFPRVLGSLPPELVDYKGITRYRDTTLAWLAKYDDGPDALEMALRLAEDVWHGPSNDDGLGDRLPIGRANSGEFF